MYLRKELFIGCDYNYRILALYYINLSYFIVALTYKNISALYYINLSYFIVALTYKNISEGFVSKITIYSLIK